MQKLKEVGNGQMEKMCHISTGPMENPKVVMQQVFGVIQTRVGLNGTIKIQQRRIILFVNQTLNKNYKLYSSNNACCSILSICLPHILKFILISDLFSVTKSVLETESNFSCNRAQVQNWPIITVNIQLSELHLPELAPSSRGVIFRHFPCLWLVKNIISALSLAKTYFCRLPLAQHKYVNVRLHHIIS